MHPFNQQYMVQEVQFNYHFTIDKMLNQNRQSIFKCLEYQQLDQAENSSKQLQQLHRNLMWLCETADLQSNSRFILREMREFVSSEDIKDFKEQYPTDDPALVDDAKLLQQQMAKQRPKQVKIPWTDEEQEKFVEGLAKFGDKKLAEIATFIGTRSKIQVRSHLQKHYLKEAKVKMHGGNYTLESSQEGCKTETQQAQIKRESEHTDPNEESKQQVSD